jgi:hypothetical protein
MATMQACFAAVPVSDTRPPLGQNNAPKPNIWREIPKAFA